MSIVVSHGHSACPQVKDLSGQRFLSNEAPALPLPDCVMKPQCKCRFRHHSDRRSEHRRVRDSGLPDASYFGPERRTGHRGRRVTDL
jgi:hypothetical protein